MLRAGFYVFSTLLPLLASISLATADPYCDETYGQPTFSDCLHVVNLLEKDSSGDIEGKRQLFFSLNGEQPPPWIPGVARIFRSNVPIFLRHG